MGIEHVVGALALGNLGLVWKFVNAAKDSAAREERQNARLDALEKRVEKGDALFDKVLERMTGIEKKLDAIGNDLHALRTELRARGIIDGAQK